MSTAKSIFQRLFYPAMIAGGVILHLWLTRKIDYQVVRLIITLSVIGIVIVLEWVIPFEKKWVKNQGDLGSDFVQTNIIVPIVSGLCLAGMMGLLLPVSARLGGVLGRSPWPDQLPLPVQLALLLLICEFFYYWIHRISHRTPFLWAFHSVHHGTGRVYWANSARFHPVDACLQSVAYFPPLVILGVPQNVVGLFLTVNLITGFLEHANIDFRAGWINYIFNTAEPHRWHHAADEGISNSNYGKVLCVWDVVFRTHYYIPTGRVGTVGLQAGSEAVPIGLIPQLLYPFRNLL